jgi:ribose transport system permease protein
MISPRRWSFQQFLAELLSKRWFNTLIPLALLFVVVAACSAMIPNYLSRESLTAFGREYAEVALVALAMGVVLVAGGVDLSVGATVALTNLAALAMFNVLQWPVQIVIPSVLALGAILGAANGFMVGFLRMRSFLTTTGTLLVYRSIYELLIYDYGNVIATSTRNEASGVWDAMADGTILGMPLSFAVLGAVALVLHLVLSRSRIGWHFAAVGASRLAARHAGLPLKRTLLVTYVISGALSALAGVFYAARVANLGSDAGRGLEIFALTAVVLGGISLAGGRGSIGQALIGALAVLMINNGLVRMGAQGGLTSLVTGVLLLLVVAADVKWLKNLHRVIARIYMAPARVKLEPVKRELQWSSGASNDRQYALRAAYAIGFQGRDFSGQEDFILDAREMRLTGPEDLIVDSDGSVLVGTSTGLVIRYSGRGLDKRSVVARIGGQVRGMHMLPDGSILSCIAGMGVYSIARDGRVSKVADEAPRTPFRLRDDSRLTAVCGITADAAGGVAYFTEASFRYDASQWLLDMIESRRNGRLFAVDLGTGKVRRLLGGLVHPMGVCVAPDGQSLLFTETWLCRVSRLWLQGPRTGHTEVVATLPGYPGYIHSAPGGGYWLGMLGARTPGFDLLMDEPRVRYRMFRQLPQDEWLIPNMNAGAAVKLSESGAVLDVLWDPPGDGHCYSTLSSVVESSNCIFFGSLLNNRIGRVRLDEVGFAERRGSPATVISKMVA